MTATPPTPTPPAASSTPPDKPADAPQASPSTFWQFLGSPAFFPGYIVLAAAILIIGMYYWTFHSYLKLPISTSQEHWGQFGDYVGGLLNPICAFMAFIWIVRSYSLQKTELAETRRALEESLDAQREQARLALLSARTQSLSIRLSAIGSTLSALRASHARAIEHANRRGLQFAIVADDGTERPASEAIPALYALIKIAEQAEDEVITALNRLAIHGTQEASETQSAASE